MGFIIQRFLELLSRDYNIEFEYTANRYFYTICLKNVHPKLRKILLGLSFERVSGFRKNTTSRGEFIGYEPITERTACVVESSDENGNPCLLIVLNEDDYGQKICKIDYAIDHFIRNNRCI